MNMTIYGLTLKEQNVIYRLSKLNPFVSREGKKISETRVFAHMIV